MNHKWVKDKSFIPHDFITEKSFCRTCGCKRIFKYYDKKRGCYLYERSGIDFFDKNPECLDWNDNSLD